MSKVFDYSYLVILGFAAAILASIALVTYQDWREHGAELSTEVALQESIDAARAIGATPDIASKLPELFARLDALSPTLGLERPTSTDELRREAGGVAALLQGKLDSYRRNARRNESRARFLIAGGAVLLAMLLLGAASHVHRLVVSLKNAEERYRYLFESNPQPMWVYDRDSLAFLAVNEAAIRRYGYSKQEFLAMTLRDIRPPEDVPRLLESTQSPPKELHSEGPWRHRRRDGTLITVEITEHPISFDRRPAFLVTPRDITSEQAALSALKLSQERLQFALDAANEGLWDWDVKTGGGYFGPRYCDILGYAPTELPTGHESWRSMVHPDDLSRITAERAEQIGRSGSFQTEYRMRKKGGEYIWVQSHGRVVSYTPEGEPERIVGTIADITERKTLEAKFYQAQRLESVGRLAGGIAHDFNNLLTVITGYSEMLMADMGDRPADRDKVAEIRGAGDRAAGLTQQLLAFSRRQILHLQPLNLNDIVAEAHRMLSRLIGEQIRLMTRLSPGIGNVLADPGQMQQVLVNLVVNSRDAMPSGGDLTIETANISFDIEEPQRHPHLRPGDYVLLAVTDSGLGMPPDILEHIFEPFFTTKPSGAGTGLGLATVYGIVKQTGGWIWAYSEPGRGTTFKIYFPRTDERETPPRARPKKDVRGREAVLLVEDQAEVRRLATRALRNYGYTVFDFASPAEALAFAELTSERIDLIVSDVIMPGMIGPDLAEKIRSRWPKLPVLLMSGYTDDAVTRRGILEAGAHYLQKPFTPEALGEKVREALDAAND